MPNRNIIDAHVHVFGRGMEGVRDMLEFQKQFGYAACNYLSCECMGDATQNALGIYLKAIAPENYIFGGLTYRYPYSYAQEAARLREIGFDGMKMVENKPTLRKELNMPSNHPAYDEFYAYMTDNGFPLLAHVADPEEMWDRAAVPDWAYERGWFYGDGSYVDKETLYSEMEDVLIRFPKMTVILAHLFFMSADLPRLDQLMQRHPQVLLDVVAGSEMYFNFGGDIPGWREFFLRYQDRIIYGTDNLNLYDAADIENAQITNRMEIEFLTREGEIPAWDKVVLGIGLPEGACDKIFRTNFQRVAGSKPNPLNKAAAIHYLRERLENRALALTEEERVVVQGVRDFLMRQ